MKMSKTPGVFGVRKHLSTLCFCARRADEDAQVTLALTFGVTRKQCRCLLGPNMIAILCVSCAQVMFGYLQESEKKFLDTRGMCRACKDAAGQPVDPLEQQVIFVNVVSDNTCVRVSLQRSAFVSLG